MNKFHSTVSRRTFMKGLGLAGAGLGAAAAATPVYHDLDELIASPTAAFKRPFWVNERDYGNPTIEVDWSQKTRFHEFDTMRGSGTRHITDAGKVDEYNQLRAAGADITKQGMIGNKPGLTLRDQAWGFAGMLNFRVPAKSGTSGVFTRGSFLGPQAAPTPEVQGVPKWQGTPEENMRMIRHVLRGFGAMSVGSVELDSNNLKLVYHGTPGKKGWYEFEDAEQAHISGDAPDAKYVIPNSYKYMIVYTNQESIANRQHEGHVMGFAPHGRYMRWANTEGCLQEFLRYIGYQGMGQGVDGTQINGLGIMPAWVTLGGLGEMSRLNRALTYEHGPIIGSWAMITNLPLAPTKPIDAGLFRFCHTCKKCHDACGNGAPSSADPTWDITENTTGGVTGYRQGGAKAFYEDQIKCRIFKATPGNCSNGRCFGACTFAKDSKAAIHQAVHALLATTPIFNGFLRTMDDVMGYGRNVEYIGNSDPRAEELWDKPLAVYGFDSNVDIDYI